MMTGLYTFSLHILPFVEGCIAATLIALLLRMSILRLREKRKVNGQICKVAGAKKTYGLEAIPQLKPSFPIIGNFPLILPLRDLWKNGLGWCDENKDFFKFCGLGQTFVIIHSAELVQTLLKSGDLGHIIKSPYVYEPLKPFVTNGVLVSKGHFWQGQRKILMKSQSFSNLKAYMGMLNKHGRKMVEDLTELYKDEKPKPANLLINRTFLCVISEMITGYDEGNNGEIDRYHHNFQIWKEAAVNRICKPWLLLNAIWMWNPLKKKHDKAVEEMFDFARRRLQKHKLEKQQSSLLVGNDGSGEDDKSSSFRSVLDELVDAGVDDQQIVDEVNTMLFGGHETGAGAIHSFCFTMALNPDFQAKCRQEIDEILEGKDDMVLNYDDVQGGLKYLERCILETLRLFPPVFLFLRQLQSPLLLVHKGKNIVLPRGTNAGVTPFGLHWKPEYFPEPKKFNPDRFLPEEAAKRSAYAYLPFSAGPRNCLGIKFAMMEMKVIAAYMLYNFEITTTDKMEDVSFLPHITTTPEKDYIFTFKKRM